MYPTSKDISEVVFAKGNGKVNNVVFDTYITDKVAFSSFFIPNKKEIFEPINCAIVRESVGQNTTLTLAFTFPTHKDKYYVGRIDFLYVPDDSTIEVLYGKTSQSMSIYKMLAGKHRYSDHKSLNFLDIYGVPAQFEKGDTILIRIVLPNSYISSDDKKDRVEAHIFYE